MFISSALRLYPLYTIGIIRLTRGLETDGDVLIGSKSINPMDLVLISMQNLPLFSPLPHLWIAGTNKCKEHCHQARLAACFHVVLVTFRYQFTAEVASSHNHRDSIPLLASF